MAMGVVEAIYILNFINFIKKNSTGNFVLIGAWQPCYVKGESIVL